MTISVKNIGGADFNSLSLNLASSDPYINISNPQVYYGAILIDSIKENITEPYNISVNPACPQGHTAQFSVLATDGAFTDTYSFSLDIGDYDYLVWNPDPTPSSGQVIHNTLSTLGYHGKYLTSLPYHEQLDKYQSVFSCFGIAPNNYFINSWNPEIVNLVNYINNQGRIYLEGGDIWAYDAYNGGYNFGPIFGLMGVEGGINNLGPVLGQTGTFTQDMNFTYSGANNSIDHIEPTTGTIIFKDADDYYVCGIANQINLYRTVGLSFELGGLTNGLPPSAKNILLDSIMHFFSIFPNSIIENQTLPSENIMSLNIQPNPFRTSAIINLPPALSATDNPQLKIYDRAGKLVKSFTNRQNSSSGNYFNWDGTDEDGKKMSAGVYFVHFKNSNKAITKRVILIN